jgi:hypothetical protein
MAKNNVLEYDLTAANNSDIASVGILGTNSPANMDNALRELMAHQAANVTRHVAKAAGSYTAVKTDHNQLWRATGMVTANLTAAATLTDGWCIWLKADGGAITVDPNGSETINGGSTLVIADGSGAFVLCNGTAFFALAFGAGDVTLTGAQTLTNKVLTLPQINDTSADHQYVFAVSELAADRTVTLPLLASADEFVFKDHAVTLTNKTLTDPVITGAVKEDVYTITDGAAFEIDPSNGTIQTITLTASRTPAATNFVSGESVTLRIADGTAYTITWSTVGVVWVNGSAPTLATSGYTIVELWKDGSTIYGARVGDVAS